MDPITAVLMGGTALSSVIGGIGANRANQQNAQIAMMNYYAQREAQRRAEAEAFRQRSEAQLGTTDAAGNRTHFVPGVGWVTDLDPEQQAIQQASEQEMLRQLQTEAARAGEVSDTAETRRGREDTLATEGEREFRQARRPDEEALRQLFLARGAATRNQSADRAGNAVARQNIRAGGRNAAQLVQGARASADAESARSAGVEATLLANQEADRRYDADRGRSGQMYDYFRRMSTSGAASPQPFMPQGPQRSSTGVQDQGLINLMARAPQQEYTNNNTAIPDTISDLTGMLGSYQQMRQNDALFNAIRDRFGKNTGAIA